MPVDQNHLHEDATQTDLQRVFSSFGPVAAVDHVSGRSYAFVRFESAAAVRSALDHNQPIEIAVSLLSFCPSNS